MKKRISMIIATMLCIVCLAANVMAAKEETKSVNVTCVNGCSGLSVLVCRKSPYLDGSSTHTSSGKSCTVLWYMDRYTGYVCPSCGNLQTSASLNMGYGDHDCYQIHGSCGRGKVIDCQGGTFGV